MSIINIFFSLCLAALCASQARAQVIVLDGTKIINDTIGKAQLLVQYETRYISNTGKPEKVTEETMMLEVGKNLSKFYSYTKYVCDSVLAVDYANKTSQEIVNEHIKQYGGSKLSERTFKGYPSRKVTTLDEVAGIAQLRCEENEERPQWKILADNGNILSYLCEKAECRFKGRTWTAWFTTEIPVSDGPWKLCGLPGLILKAEDSEGHYSFTATGMEQCHTDKPILFDGRKYEPVNRKEYDQVHMRFYADPIGFVMGNTPDGIVTIKDEHGNETKSPKNLPYNPLERRK